MTNLSQRGNIKVISPRHQVLTGRLVYKICPWGRPGQSKWLTRTWFICDWRPLLDDSHLLGTGMNGCSQGFIFVLSWLLVEKRPGPDVGICNLGRHVIRPALCARWLMVLCFSSILPSVACITRLLCNHKCCGSDWCGLLIFLSMACP